MKIKQVLEKISPRQAQEYLEKNKRNRRLSVDTVNFYLDQMKRGQWKITGDSIKFADNGDLLDGQHRLAALANHTEPVEMYVTRNLPPETFKVIDTGKSRSSGDVLHMNGVKNATTVAATVRGVLQFERGSYHASKNRMIKGISNTDMISFIGKHKEIVEIVEYCQSLYLSFRYIPASTLGMLYFILSRKNQTQTDKFFEGYGAGIDLGIKSPIRIMRNRLISTEPDRKLRLTARAKAALFIHAWNAYMKKQELSHVRLNGDFEFPKPI